MLTMSYFSYKGGSGRSSLAYNSLPLFYHKLRATPSEPIVVVDLDIDSAGLTFLLKQNNDYSKYLNVQEIVTAGVPGSGQSPEYTPIDKHPFFSRLLPAGNEFGLEGADADRSILFLRAEPGKAFGGGSTYDLAGNRIKAIKDLCTEYNCKALVFDTPAGDQLTANWALDLSKKVITCMRITYQFQEGTFNFICRKDAQYANKEFVLVPNAVPTEIIEIDGVPFDYEAVKQNIRNWEVCIENNKLNLNMVGDDFFGVPEVKRFKLIEGILYKLNKLTEDEMRAKDAYQRLVDVVCGG